jgi:hypothetical protein
MSKGFGYYNRILRVFVSKYRLIWGIKQYLLIFDYYAFDLKSAISGQVCRELRFVLVLSVLQLRTDEEASIRVSPGPKRPIAFVGQTPQNSYQRFGRLAEAQLLMTTKPGYGDPVHSRAYRDVSEWTLLCRETILRWWLLT